MKKEDWLLCSELRIKLLFNEQGKNTFFILHSSFYQEVLHKSVAT